MSKRIRISVPGRIAISLVMLSTCTWVTMYSLIPSARQLQIERRTALCESLSISCSLHAERNDDDAIRKNLHAVAQRNPDIVSACLRRVDGRIVEQIGDHQNQWRLEPNAHSTPNNIYVPIRNQGKEWGKVEVSFDPSVGWFGFVARHPLAIATLFGLSLNSLIFRWYIGRVLTYLDPSKSVPTHVRSTLDTFVEGVVVLDDENRIVLANESFTQQVGKSVTELQGKDVDTLPWQYDEEEADSPWTPHASPSDVSDSKTGIKLSLRLSDENDRTFLVNASAILSEDGKKRGTIASFDDITLMERKKQELSRMLIELKQSRNELTLRNQELQYLATRDPLTGCLNRRSFFETFEKLWGGASRYQHPLSCYMVDVDHFKLVNDNHGHSVGDEVLRRVAETILETARNADIVCRYGGEEFCVLLPHTEIGQAVLAAERLRRAIEQLEFDNLSITASVGVSSFDQGATDPQGLLDQADQCLYVAKRCGRNQVTRWDEIPGDIVGDEIPTAEKTDANEIGVDLSIPYAAVTSLLSALAYRDADTAAHSTRVAELCVATARGMMSQKEIYALEIAALLHDIGKIGVPDAILLKPGPLTREEWETMKLHDHIGVEIVEASFANQQLVETVRYHHATYGGSPDAPHLPQGDQIPLGARIVTIADAYDAMVSDRVYRKGRSKEEAFEELRRCAGRQFDPVLVEHFIRVATNFGSPKLSDVSKQSALQIGQQIERLAQAVDAQDKSAIKALASRLESTASHCGIPEIEKVAGEIKDVAGDDGEIVALVEMVSELIDLCSSTQKIYADVPRRNPTLVTNDGVVRRTHGNRPIVQQVPDDGVVLIQNLNQDRENRIELNLIQREQAGNFLKKTRAGETVSIEQRLRGGDDQADALLRISSEGEVNLTQLVGSERRANVVFDTVEGMAEWAFTSEAADSVSIREECR